MKFCGLGKLNLPRMTCQNTDCKATFDASLTSLACCLVSASRSSCALPASVTLHICSMSVKMMERQGIHAQWNCIWWHCRDTPFGDGPDGHSLWPSFTNVPNEFMEQYCPVRVELCESIADSSRLVYRLLADGAINIHDDR